MSQFLILILLLTPAAITQCLSIQEAPKNIGKKTCVTGKVLKVQQSQNGAFFLDFCEDYTQCPFTVVVLPLDLQDVGDVRLLQGKEIQIHGKIKDWKGRAEIVLKDVGQLHGADSTKLPPIPKTYDADRRGNFSSGTFKGNRSTRRTHKRPTQPSPDELDVE
jgi:hypothetical protein